MQDGEMHLCCKHEGHGWGWSLLCRRVYWHRVLHKDGDLVRIEIGCNIFPALADSICLHSTQPLLPSHPRPTTTRKTSAFLRAVGHVPVRTLLLVYSKNRFSAARTRRFSAAFCSSVEVSHAFWAWSLAQPCAQEVHLETSCQESDKPVGCAGGADPTIPHRGWAPILAPSSPP